MDNTHPKWSRLPAEILLNIFRRVPKHQLNDFALVSRSWTASAQLVMFSNVKIRSIPHLGKLYHTIENNPCLGTKVRTLHILFDMRRLDYSINFETVNFFTNLLSTFLPNLRSINGSYDYTSVLNALSAGQLKHSKELRHPSDNEQQTYYVTCALLMKDQLEKIYIDETTNQAISQHQGLYDSLHQFDNLTSIYISKVTNNEIQVFEHITESCRFLDFIQFSFTEPNNSFSQDDTSMGDILNMVPKHNVSHLHGDQYSQYKLISYIMHKFPQLDYLWLNFNGRTTPLSSHTIFQLISFVSRITELDLLNLVVQQTYVCETVQHYWDEFSTVERKVLIMRCSEEEEEEETKMDLLRSVSGTAIVFNTLEFTFEWQLWIDVIQRNGEPITDIDFDFSAENPPYSGYCVFPHNLLSLVFTHCPKIQTSKLNRCALEEYADTEMGLNKKLSIIEIELAGCLLHEGVLEQSSFRLTKIKQLRLSDTIHRTANNQHAMSNQIVMPYTSIDNIALYYFGKPFFF